MKCFQVLPLIFVSVISFAQTTLHQTHASRLVLRDGWALQSSAKVEEKGETISTQAFQPKEWLAAAVPTTVVAAQVKSGLLPDPFFGMNLRQYPGVGYPIGFNFSNIPMPPDSPPTAEASRELACDRFQGMMARVTPNAGTPLGGAGKFPARLTGSAWQSRA